VEDVYDHVRLAIEKDYMATDEHVCAVGRRRRQATLQLLGTGVHTLLQTRRKRAPDD